MKKLIGVKQVYNALKFIDFLEKHPEALSYMSKKGLELAFYDAGVRSDTN